MGGLRHQGEYLVMADQQIFGMSWDTIQRLQQGDKNARPTIDLDREVDYGADPLDDGSFRMIPSGDIVDFAERCRRLER